MSSSRKPGWLMSVAQHAHYFNMLGDVFKKLNIPSGDREAYRKQIHTAVFGSPISAKEINSTDMFGKIKNHLLMLLDNVQATVETDHPEHDEQRRKLNFIRSYQFPLLRVLLGRSADFQSAVSQTSSLHAHDPAEAYIKPIIRNRFKASVLEDVSAAPRLIAGQPAKSQLELLIMDIARAIQSKRKAADMTVHDLHAAAEMICPSSTGCLICYPRHAVTVPALVSTGATDDDNVPF